MTSFFMSSLPRCFAIADTIHPVRPARALAGIVPEISYLNTLSAS